MPINNQILDTIRQADLSGANIAELFEQLAVSMAKTDSSAGLLILQFIRQEQLPAEGELVPTLTLALKPFTYRSNDQQQDDV